MVRLDYAWKRVDAKTWILLGWGGTVYAKIRKDVTQRPRIVGYWLAYRAGPAVTCFDRLLDAKRHALEAQKNQDLQFEAAVRCL